MLTGLMQGHRIDLLERRTLLAFSVGGGGFDYGSASARLDDGSLIVAGLFSGTVSFDPGGGTTSTLTSSGTSDAFIAKYDAGEQLLWVRQFGGPEGKFEQVPDEFDEVVDVAIDPVRAGGEFYPNGVGADPIDAGEYINSLAIAPNGSIYVTGAFRGRADFDPGPGTALLDSGDWEFYDAFVMKLTGDGALLWANDFGGRFTDVGNDIALDSAGNPYVTGVFTRTADFQPGRGVTNLEAVGRNDAFVMKLSVNGKLIWAGAVGSDEISRELTESGNGIAVDSVGNAYVTGTFAGLADFNPTPGRRAQFFVEALDETDGFVMQLSTRGKLAWVRTFGGFEFDGGVSVALGNEPANPSVYVGGYFEDVADVTVNGTTTTLRAAPVERGDDPESTDLLVSRYANDGTLTWAKQLGGGGFETIGRIATDQNDNVYLTGGFWGRADFDPSRARVDLVSTPAPFEMEDPNDRGVRRFDSYDGYFASLDDAGRFNFARSFGGNLDDFSMSLSRVAPGEAVTAFALTGRIDSTANLNPDGSFLRTARGRGDIFASLFALNGDFLE